MSRNTQMIVVPTTGISAVNQEQVELNTSPNAVVVSQEVTVVEDGIYNKAGGLGVSFHDICYEVPQWKCCIRKPNKQILKNLTGLMTPGLNAIMGPTGSGKTTLLDILAGRKKKSGLTGRVLINGEKQPENFKCMSGYVVQENILMGTLTVRENLYFSAALRLPSKMSWNDKKALVSKIIDELGLSKCADSKVGTEFFRGVSGGEGKRTNIGMELIIEPRVLFLDEPTTGLDAFTAISVVQLLKNLSQRQNRIVIVSIHQPRYSIFKLCDRLTLLSQGEMVYHGPAQQSLEYFDHLGYGVEEHDNPADHFLDVINTCEQAMDERRKEMVQASNPAIVTHTGSEEKKVINLGEFYMKSEEYRQTKSLLDPLLGNLQNKEKVLSPSRKITYATSFIWQLLIVTLRTITNLVRNPMTSIIQVFIDMLFGLIVGLIYFQLDLTARGFSDRLGAIFFISSNQVFGSLPSVQTFIQERNLLIHENAGGYYRLPAFFLAKIFGNLIPNKIIPLIGFAILSYFLMGFQAEADRFFIFLLTLWLTSLASSSYGFMIGAAFRVSTVAELLITTSYVVFMLFGGFLIALESLPVWVRWIQYLSIMRWSVEAMAINELDGLVFSNDNTTSQGSGMSNGSADCAFTGLEQLTFLGFNTSWLWYDELALLGFTVIFLILAYIFLAFNIKRRE